MPRLEDGTAAMLDAKDKASRAWDGFIDFVFSDNVLEVAVGLIIAAAFTKVINSFVSDILLPPISLIPGIGRNFDQKFAVLRHGESSSARTHGYNTLKQAQDDGAVVLGYGGFIDKLINFFVIGLALYVVAQTYQWTSGDKVIKRTVKCKYCRKRISDRAQRCVNCTSWQDGREE